MKRRDKSKKDPKNIKNINKENFWHQAQVHSNRYKKKVKPKRKHTTLETQSSLMNTSCLGVSSRGNLSFSIPSLPLVSKPLFKCKAPYGYERLNP